MTPAQKQAVERVREDIACLEQNAGYAARFGTPRSEGRERWNRNFAADLRTLLALLDEVTYWRQDAAARLRTALELARAAEKAGEERRAAEIRVSILMPTRAALTNALTGDIYWPLCEGCGKPLKGGDAVFAIGDEEGFHCGDAHVDCDQPQLTELPAEAYRFAEDDDYSPEKIAATLAEVKTYLDGEEADAALTEEPS